MTTKELLEKYDILTRDSLKERPLWLLLKAHEDEIAGKIEEDQTGEWLHKSFRQNDVTGCGYTDMAIHELMRKARIFWQMLNGEYDDYI